MASRNFDRTAPLISGLVTVIAGSGKTGNDSRDKKMNRDILKVDQFTTVSFAPEAYRGMIAASGDSTIHVTGIFTLLGNGHEVTIPMQIHIVGSTATSKTQFVVSICPMGTQEPEPLFWKAESDVAIDLRLVGLVSK